MTDPVQSSCKEEINDSCHNWVAIQWKEAKQINECSVKRKDSLVVAASAKVHISCRQRYINKKTFKAMLRRKAVVLYLQRKPRDNQIDVLPVKHIAYSVDVQFSKTREIHCSEPFEIGIAILQSVSK